MKEEEENIDEKDGLTEVTGTVGKYQFVAFVLLSLSISPHAVQVSLVSTFSLQNKLSKDAFHEMVDGKDALLVRQAAICRQFISGAMAKSILARDKRRPVRQLQQICHRLQRIAFEQTRREHANRSLLQLGIRSIGVSGNAIGSYSKYSNVCTILF